MKIQNNKDNKEKENFQHVEIMLTCGCGRKHRWRIHNTTDKTWVEKYMNNWINKSLTQRSKV